MTTSVPKGTLGNGETFFSDPHRVAKAPSDRYKIRQRQVWLVAALEPRLSSVRR